MPRMSPGVAGSPLIPQASISVTLNYGSGQNVSFTDASVQSAAIIGTHARIVATEDCYYCVGADPVAVISGASALLPAGVCEVIQLTSGQKIAAIRVSTSGTLNVIPGNIR